MKINHILSGLILLSLLSACSGLKRQEDAAAAKAQMIGMNREELLACMGPAKKKATVGETEVWSYLSTDDTSNYNGDTFKSTGYVHTTGTHDRNFCTVNVVMKNNIVTAIRYNGPSSSTLFYKDDQCGYAVANCVKD